MWFDLVFGTNWMRYGSVLSTLSTTITNQNMVSKRKDLCFTKIRAKTLICFNFNIFQNLPEEKIYALNHSHYWTLFWNKENAKLDKNLVWIKILLVTASFVCYLSLILFLQTFNVESENLQLVLTFILASWHKEVQNMPKSKWQSQYVYLELLIDQNYSLELIFKLTSAMDRGVLCYCVLHRSGVNF